MSYSTWIKGNDLRSWADTIQARQKLPALVRRLIHATVENPELVQFPADEGVQRPEWDGLVKTVQGNAWVPSGESAWEMGTDKNPKKKADSDYEKRMSNTGGLDISASSFVFVTPRRWAGKSKWKKTRIAEKKWKNVLVWDCDDLEQWLETAPAVDAWLSRLIGKMPIGVRDITSHWNNLAEISDPPLSPSVFLSGRDQAATDIRRALAGPPAEVVVSALSLQELRDFVSALAAYGNDEVQDAAAARLVVVESRDAWNQLTTCKNHLVLIPDNALTVEQTMVSEAVKSGHHVLTQHEYSFIRDNKGIRLPRAERYALKETLKKTGFSEEKAERLAREAGGCMSVLVRLASKYEAYAAPEWSHGSNALLLTPLLLLGAWENRNPADIGIVEQITGRPYAGVLQTVTQWLNSTDAPMRFVDGIYSFVSREDSWRLLKPYLTSAQLDSFSSVLKDVLWEDDPRFDMPEEERYLAAIQNKLPKYSHSLREGISETLALLGTCGQDTPRGVADGSAWRAAVAVRSLFEDASPRRWFSLAGLLPLLAEAAPDEFLSALETDLKLPSPNVAALFALHTDGMFSSSPHVGLMWALALIAWDAAHLSRVAMALSSLIRIDTGNRSSPRPAGVLQDIFRFWCPQTASSTEERLQVLDLLKKEDPETAWTVLMSLVPHDQDMAMSSCRPRWREYDASQFNNMTYEDIHQQMDSTAEFLIQLAADDCGKWCELLNEFPRFRQTVKNQILNWFSQIDAGTLKANERLRVWNTVRVIVRKHRYFNDAEWAMPAEVVDDLAKLEAKFMPTDPIDRSQWLFQSENFHAFGNCQTPFEEAERLRTAAQNEAVKEIFHKHGLAGITRLASGAYSPYIIGASVAAHGLIPDWRELLPEMLQSSNRNILLFARGYASHRMSSEGNSWLDSLPLEEWKPEAVAEIFLATNVNKKAWETLRQRKPDAEPIFWKRVHPYAGRMNDDEMDEAVRMLLKAGRPLAAIDALSMSIHSHKKPSWSLVADAIDLASLKRSDSQSSELINQHSIWDLAELMKYLEDDPTADQERVVALEWRLMSLARFNRFAPKALHGELARNPMFFAEIISKCYREKHAPQLKDDQRDETKMNIVMAAYTLLDSWLGIPGATLDGNIDKATLEAWVSEARSLCKANDRIEVCDLKIGEQLSYAPEEPDGSWPCLAVREVMEAVLGDEILRGFQSGVINQRGVVSRHLNEGGEQERELVAKYRGYAELCKIRWPRTARILRSIAEGYASQARHEDERAEGRD